MKRVYYIVILVLLGIGAVYVWGHRAEISFLNGIFPNHPVDGLMNTVRTKQLVWQSVDKSDMGFKLEMPGEPKQVVVQATNEGGTMEPVSMLLVKGASDMTFAIAWAEKPPVARVNDMVPDKTLDQARDGAMANTQTTLVSESRTTPQGFAGRDIVAHNVGGGFMDTRFIYAGSRLYMLIASSPSAAARREEAVNHFFNSFTLSGNMQIPETIPAANR